MSFSSKSFWTIETDNSTKVFAKAASDSSYKYYNNMTWSMWGMWAPGQNKAMFSMYEDTSSNNRSWLFSSQSDGTFRVIGSWDGANICLLKTSNPVLDLSWHHYVVTFSNGVFNVYVDNVLQSLTTILPWSGGSTLNAANLQVTIANFDVTSGPNVDSSACGGYSNFSMWNKVLNSTELTSLYNNGQPADLTQHSAYANLTNWWRMDQTDTAPTLIDSRASSANATITLTGSTPFFQQNNNVPTHSTDPGIANVRQGTAYTINGSSLTGTLDLPATSNVKISVQYDGNSKTGTYDGSDRWTSPSAGQLAQGVQLKSNSTSLNLTGTLGAITNIISNLDLTTPSFEAVLEQE